jgi:biopolymer transport protein ExbB/TolQ
MCPHCLLEVLAGILVAIPGVAYYLRRRKANRTVTVRDCEEHAVTCNDPHHNH